MKFKPYAVEEIQEGYFIENIAYKLANFLLIKVSSFKILNPDSVSVNNFYLNFRNRFLQSISILIEGDYLTNLINTV